MRDRLRFRQQPDTRARGRVGEDDAVRWLTARGYRLVARNLRNRGGEIDVVAEHDGTLCFVEIKARANAAYGPAIGAVPHAKQRRISRAAALYLARHDVRGPCRFDVLAMDLDASGRWRFQLVTNAFEATDGAW
ncbi:MAG: YraN family protein [Acidobacteriota bacterium]